MKANVAAMILIFALTALFQISPHRASAPGPSGPVKGVSPSTAESGTSATVDLTEIVAKPGDEVHFSIQLNYTAVQPITTITYSLRTQYLPSDWTARIWYKGQEIRGITVSNKKLPDKLDLEIDIPETAEVGNYSFWFLAIGRESVAESAILQLQVEVKALKREVKLSCDHPSVGLDSDGVARFSLTLNNFGDVDERLNLTCEAPSGWKALFKEQTKTIYEIIIPASASKKVEVEAMPPAYAAPGVYCLSVSGLSGDRASSSTLDLKVVVLESAERVVSALYPELSEEAGKKITFPITLKNLGAGSDIYRISTSSLPSGWVSYFRTAPGSSTSVSSVTLEGGKSTDLYLEIVPPKAVEVGTYNIPVLVTSDSGATYAIDLKATIVGSYDLTLKSSTLLTSVTSGATTTFTATVTNTGNTPVTSVRLNFEGPDGWDSSITPVMTELLEASESSTFTVAVKTPEDAVAGDYMITLTGLSDQVESDVVQVRVTVTTPTSWGLMGIGVAAAMITALLVVFMKFRRR